MTGSENALASTIDPESRVVRHRELAHALEATGGDAERIAVHSHQAMEPELCSRYALEAAHRALGVMAFNKAAQLLQLALATGALQADTRRVVQRQLGDALANAGRGAEAANHYLSAASDASSRDQLNLKQRAAEELLFSGHVDEGLAIFEQLLAQVGMRLPTRVGTLPLSLVVRRMQLKFRGLRWRERDAAALPKEALLKLDACSAVATGLALIDIARGASLRQPVSCWRRRRRTDSHRASTRDSGLLPVDTPVSKQRIGRNVSSTWHSRLPSERPTRVSVASRK